ncbi:Coenzyme F420 hydrogenase/dehydrogenase, beta subunit C-terminal domain [Oceanobacillus oncorhynchi subsp. oncorhynchi]|uniref:Coenzyme F420 hydrogenase/dehydrogenase, beta subunit C-terminal domain n=1 Tax=Oceanobacillus oncorhynchi TaxID=545501 RepID=UPI0031E45822
MNNIEKLMNTVIENDYCIGCGACASLDNSPFEIKFNENGEYKAYLKEEYKNNVEINNINEICPFSNDSDNETEIGRNLFEDFGASFNKYTGYYLKNYAGYVKESSYRDNGSSGGMGSWIAAQLLEQNLVDSIIHVRESAGENETLFEYQVSTTKEDFFSGAKSKYYPIELSQVMSYVKENDGRYAIIGIPCFIKSVRLLSAKNSLIKERIKYCIGLVCGHLKSDFFAKAQGWQIGIHPDDLTSIDFRVKLDGRNANDYGIEAKGIVDNEEISLTKARHDLYTTNWGQGHFKYNACEFCDDVLSETADVTVGDAWLPEYKHDSNGTNIVVVRNPDIIDIIEQGIANHKVQLDRLTADKMYESQAGGFRQRRDGLAYRLYLKDQKGEWRPNKRVKASDDLRKNRKKVYAKRMELSQKSFEAFKYAKEKGSFDFYINRMEKPIKEYNNIINPSFIRKIINRIF